MAKISWTNSSGGTWSVGSNWSNGDVPGPNDNVTIAIAPGQGLTSYTVELNTDAVVKSLALDQAAATLEVGDGSGDGTLSTHLKLEAGTLALAFGTLTGQVADTGGLLTLSAGNYNYYGAGTLQNVTWEGNLQPELGGNVYEGTLSVLGSLTLTGAKGTGPGTMTLGQANAGVNFVDTQTLDNATVYLGASDVYEEYAFLSSSSDGNGAAALTLGTNLALDVSGNGAIYDTGQITNDGTISTAGTALLDLTSQYYGQSTFTNSGVMDINAGAEAIVQIYDFVNNGSIDIAAGGTFDLAYTYYGINTFQNSGSFIDDGTIQLDGTLSTSMIQGLNIDYGAGGEMALSGYATLNNAGATLELGTGGTAPAFAVSGTIIGGTITENDGDLVGAGGTLNGVALNGPLLLTGSYSSLSVTNGLQLDLGATLSITGDSAGLYFDSTDTLDQVVVNLGSSDGATLGTNYGATLTLGSSVQVNVDGGTANIGGFFGDEVVNQGNIDVADGGFAYFGQDAAFVNQGTLSVTNGSTLLVSGGFSNSGVVTIADSTLLLGDVNASALDNVTITDSTVGIVGTFNATGATIDVGTGTQLGDVIIGLSYPGYDGSGAGIQGGTIHDAGGGLTIEGNVAFTDVTYQGVMSVNAAYSVVTVSDLTLEGKNGKSAGTLVLSGAQSALLVAGGTTLDNATVDIGSSIIRQGGTTLDAPTIVEEGYGGSLVLGANLVIDQTAKYAGIGGNSPAFDMNSDATINAAFKGGQMLLDGYTFTSGGALNIGAGEVVTSAAGSFTNTGSVSIASGGTLTLNLLNYYLTLPDSGTSFENDGRMVLLGGTITEQSGNGVPQVPLRNDAAANISGTGIIAAEIANYGTVTATGGALTLSQAISGGGGVLDVAANATLSLLRSVSAGETAQFGGADGVLGLSAKQFLGEIGGFAKGDTIDLFKLDAKAASFVGSSIAVTLSNGSTISLALTAPGSGSLTVTGDGHGGSLIAFAGAGAEAAIVPVVPEAAVPAWALPENVAVKVSYWESMSQHWGH